ncbi:MAG TPA: hypothetical protein DIT13_17590 [Verrucomicrobiales bacterium]|nr:hypothetical protein [Verrucomicrobiales bacterium]
MLATREPRRPKQATIRRSISTSYYALFHFLIEEAALVVCGAAHADQRMRQMAGRAFDHGKMKSLCREFVKQNAQQVHSLLQTFWPQFNIPGSQHIRLVAQTFIDLQEERHEADYDMSVVFSRQEALNAVSRVDAAIHSWRHLKQASRDTCRLFAISLALWPSLASRQ